MRAIIGKIRRWPPRWHRLAGLTAAASLCGLFLWASDKEKAGEGSADRDFTQAQRPATAGMRRTLDRAFFGAPPPVPHSLIGERNSKNCLQCHALENRIEKRHQAIAPVPHAEFSQCMQCHVRASGTDGELFRENNFVGLDFPGKGSRVSPLAPPTVPHKTFMRENCLSCHGASGDFAIRTPHPMRSQCLQCHVPEASQDYSQPLFE